MKVEHGGNAAALAEEFGFSLEDCLDFSANINPLGISPRLRACLTESIDWLVHYPDISYSRSRELLAHHHDLEKDKVLLANGAVEVFYELARFLRPKTVLTLSPTFMEYEKAFSQVQAKVERFSLPSPSYEWNLADMLPALDSLTVGDAVLICNPNNPTGTLIRRTELEKLAEDLQERQIFLILDEAFMDFLDDEEAYSFVSCLAAYPNAVVVRSLTKFYAIPGLRLGYALSCHPTVLLEDEAYQQATKQWLRVERDFLFQGLTAFSQIRPVKPSVNYIFFEYLGQQDLRQELRQRKIFIRSCQNYHDLTDRHYRIAIRSHQENEQLLACLTEVLAKEAPYD